MGNSSNKSSVKVAQGNTDKLSSNQIKDMLIDQLNLTDKTKIVMNDRDYISVDENRLKAFAKKDGTSNLKYKEERADCDDFTRVFLGRVSENIFKYGSNNNAALAIGEVQGLLYIDNKPIKHSMVIYITNNKIKLLEPQNDKIHSTDTRNEYWFIHL